MGLLDRIWRLIRANFNSLVNQAEDPEKILEQTVIDMQNDVIQLRQAVAQAIATQKRTERQAAQAQANADEWYQRAQLALQKGEEGLAREALTRRKSFQDTANALTGQLDQQSAIVTKLKQNMVALEGKLSEARTKKDMYIARARSAQASQQLNDMLGRMNPNGAMAAFERMEERVQQIEAQAEAVAELNEGDDIDRRFQALENGGDVDSELAAMKSQLLRGGSTAPQLQSKSVDPEVEADLKQLRSQLEEI
ncbi:PspA/IM30 family protein [Leptolyngbya sp. FACHB-711]|uniref:PspA/IM30 family protein n=1 Tax=unclassified Leptolyngbya TaxID=2650499 RepID=UPI001688B01A|nr:PspA/IM30 family protein [Leptolyngbya sp. FACHB-711]MBD1848802.1 PspA/IM30 family protein [Cyanobacteria bacterium FACHB-502]MBD2027147.1 PspA/IM30 family protein [Leptolyngbya sp. FACHB-711]